MNEESYRVTKDGLLAEVKNNFTVAFASLFLVTVQSPVLFKLPKERAQLTFIE